MPPAVKKNAKSAKILIGYAVFGLLLAQSTKTPDIHPVQKNNAIRYRSCLSPFVYPFGGVMLAGRFTTAIYDSRATSLFGQVLFFVILLLISTTASAQSAQLQHFTGKDGLAQSQVYCLLEDRRGYLWLGTQGGGLNRFDGLAFKTWRTKDGLPNNYVDALHEDPGGRLWIGTKNGLSCFDGFTFNNFRDEDAPSDFDITTILQRSDTTLWIGTGTGLYTFDGHQWKRHRGIPAAHINHLHSNAQGLWVSTTVGLYLLTKNGVKPYGANEGFFHRDVRATATDHYDGTVWAATYTGGLYGITRDSVVRKTVNDGIKGQHLQTLYTDHGGNLWIGSQDRGISFWMNADSSFQYLNQSSGLLRNDVRAILQDRWGHIWIGTTGGLSRYAGREFGQLLVNPASNDNNVYAICEDTLGNLWLSASSRGIARWQDGQLTHYGRDSGFIDTRCKALFVDQRQRLWIGTERHGLALFDGEQFQFFTPNDGLRGKFIKDIEQDSSGLMYVATNNGIFTIHSKDSLMVETSIVVDSLEHQISDTYIRRDTMLREHFVIKPIQTPEVEGTYIYDLQFDQRHRLWYASRYSGMGCIAGDSLIHHWRKGGSRVDLPDNQIRSMAIDKEGYLWAGTANAGILRFGIENDQPLLISFSESDGLYSNNVYLLLFDNENNLWAGYENGVDRIQLNEARQIADLRHFDRTDGFSGIETCTNAALNDSRGRLWFGTVNGLMQYLPESGQQTVQPPVVHLSGVRIGYKLLENTQYAAFAKYWGGASDGLVLPHYDNQLQFGFKAVHQEKPQQIQYEYYLEGWDDRWLGPYGQNAPAHYSNLPPGDYTFHVRASTGEGVYNVESVSWSFSIRPPFWRTNWFFLAAVLSGLLLFFILAKAWVNRIRRQAAAKTERLEMEKNLLELEQRALQLQMNPHFIFNVLNSIQSLISQKDEKTARYYLAKFSKLMRAILENSRSEKIPLDQEIETLEHYLSIERFSRDEQFDYEVYVDPKLDTESILIAPMLLQPFLENAIIHGVGQVKEGGRVKLSFLQKFGTLECIVEDNGPGLAAARQRKSQQEHTHKSAALEVTRERLDILNPLAKGKSLEVIDRVALGEGLGTKVVVRLLLG